MKKTEISLDDQRRPPIYKHVVISKNDVNTRQNLPSSFLALKCERGRNPRSKSKLPGRLESNHSTLHRNEDLTRIYEKRRGRILI